jgi:hypothetical protein
MTTYLKGDIGGLFGQDVVDMFYKMLEPAQAERPGVDVGNVLNIATSLGVTRSEYLERPPMPHDVGFVLSIFCWYPLKPPSSQEYRDFSRDHLDPLLARGDLDAVTRTIVPVSLMLPIETLHRIIAAPYGRQMLFVDADY